MAADLGQLEEIRRINQELTELGHEIKEFQADLRDEVEALDAYLIVQDKQAELKTAKLQLKAEIESNGTVTAAMENIAELKFKQKDLKEILSAHLNKYHADTEDVQVPLEEDGRARALVIKASLGREEYYQEHMDFAKAGKEEPTSEPTS